MSTPADAPTEPGGADWGDGGPFELGATMGRYRLKSIVGAGGMGVVFEALDPELDRTVAVKVLRSKGGTGSEGELRLRREGQTMARLTHPNVIRVYDVGISHGHMFVAMEFVAGGTLADWLQQAPRPPTEILGVFVQAGRGLAAAHATGLVHRDFKPSNVMVGTDGRVLVTDFGLARTARTIPPGEAKPPPPPPISASSPTIDATLTRAGEFVGTPAYMAPEQFAGLTIDARADQFSFCVALWRALYGTAPYEGETLEALYASTGSGEVVAPPATTAHKVGPGVRAALERGLRTDPTLRFPTMNDLLAVIEPRPSRRPLYAALAVAAVVVVGAVTWGILGTRKSAADPCPAPDAEIAAVWSPARKAMIRDHLVAIDPAAGPGRFTAATAALDRGVPAWRDLHVAACRATRVEGKQSDTLLDARMRCLAEWRDQLATAITGLEQATDAATLEGAVKAVSSLAPLGRCSDLVALQAASQLPEAPADRAAAVALIEEARAVNADRKAGKRDGLDERGDALIARARALNNPATLAKALAVRWRIAVSGGDMATGLKYLHELTEVAARGHDDTEAAHAWALMGRLTALSLGKPQEAKVMMTAARAASARAGDPPELKASVLTNEADVLNAAGEGPTAIASLAEARALLDGLGAREPGSPHAAALAALLQTESNVHWFAGELAEATTLIRQAIELFDRTYGPDTIDSSSAYLDLAQVLRDDMKLEEAEVAASEGLRIRALREPASANTALALMIQAEIRGNRGLHAEALAIADRAYAMARAAMPPDDPQLAMYATTVANEQGRTGHLEEARAGFTAVLADLERAGVETINVPGWTLNLADIERRLGRCDDAIAHFRKGGALGRKLQGDDSPYVGDALRGEAQCLVDQGKKVDAIAVLERASKFRSGPAQAADAALANGVLGMLLADTGRDRARGRALVREAVDYVTANGDAQSREDPRLEQLATWLAKQR